MKTKFCCIICIFLCSCQLACGQYVRLNNVPAYIQVSACSASPDAAAFAGNPASLSSKTHADVAVLGENRFMLQELSYYLLTASVPCSFGSLGFAGSYQGISMFHQSCMGMAYSRKMGSVSAAIRFDYYSVNTLSYGTSFAVSAGAGFIYEASDKFHLGISMSNPVQPKLAGEDGILPFTASLDWGYNPADYFFIGGEIKKESGEPLTTTVGAQLELDHKIFARLGITSGNTSFYLGAGVLYHHLRVNAITSWHPQLGLSPGLMLEYVLY